MKKLFVIKKYILADNAQEAIKKDKTHKVDDVWMDDDFRKREVEKLFDKEDKKIGFIK